MPTEFNVPLSNGPATLMHCLNCTQVKNEAYNLYVDSNMVTFQCFSGDADISNQDFT